VKRDHRLRRCPTKRWGPLGKETRRGAIRGLAANDGFEQSGRGRGRWRREISQGWNWGHQIFQSETWKRELILSLSFFGGGEGGGWLGATRPSDTRDHPETMLRCLKAPAFVSMTCGPNRWLAHMSVTQRQLPLRHRSSVHPDMTLVCLVRLHLRMQTNLYVLPCPCFPCNN
jgi:hypothetical protein